MRRGITTGVLAAALLAGGTARAEFMDLWVRRDDVGEKKVPRLGRSRIVVLPVDVRAPGIDSLDRLALEDFYTGEDDARFLFKSWLKAASGGRYVPEVELAPTLLVEGCPAVLRGECTLPRGDVEEYAIANNLLRQLLDRVHRGCWNAPTECDPELGLDFGRYDLNGAEGVPDGWADGVLVVTNLPDINISVPIYTQNGPGPGDLAGGRGGSFVLGGAKVSMASLCGKPLEEPQRLEHVCVHEFGHLLGLADFHQEPKWGLAHPTLVYPGLRGSAMGAWRHDASAPLLDAESRYRLRWADAIVVNGTRTLTLPPAGAGGPVVKLGVQTATRREYFLAEARGPVGPFDQEFRRWTDGGTDGLPVYGLALYHVDWSRGPTGNPGTFLLQVVECLNCDPWKSFVSNVQADGRWDVQLNRPFKPEQDLFLEGSYIGPGDEVPFGEGATWSTNWWDGTPSGIEIRNISVNPANGAVTAEFVTPVVPDVCADVSCEYGERCVDGNCVPDVEPLPPPDAGTRPPPGPKDDDDGWDCSSAPAGLLAALAGLALARLARRARRNS